MPEGHRHLTHTGRCQIHALMKSGLSNAAVARQLGRSPSSVPREIRRNGGARGQRHAQAQRRAEARPPLRLVGAQQDDAGAVGAGGGAAGAGLEPCAGRRAAAP